MARTGKRLLSRVALQRLVMFSTEQKVAFLLETPSRADSPRYKRLEKRIFRGAGNPARRLFQQAHRRHFRGPPSETIPVRRGRRVVIDCRHAKAGADRD